MLHAWPLPDQPQGGGKEQRGRVLVVGGQRDLAGAVRLAGEAALRAGAGKLQLAVAADAAPALAIAVPEARVLGLSEAADGGIASGGRWLAAAAARADALVLGPGTEKSVALRALARRLLPRLAGTVVLDAGALDLPLLRTWHHLRRRPAAIVTPHHGEMAALLGCDEASVAAHAPRLAAAFARAWNLVVVLKSADTWIADASGGVWLHRNGPPGLGTSGSGDVLAGLIGGLCARG
ncbi:NAD(P)H-hydrate dehydratase, partial [Luteimonas sp. SDU101]|uniref:NAD(P)H-hydrate dehydratase n=1 Tax=Luteimonas sp. SDU101 TaxID=3422593 RepID=UPI003EC1236C